MILDFGFEHLGRQWSHSVVAIEVGTYKKLTNINLVTICNKLGVFVTCPSRHIKYRAGHSRLNREIRVVGRQKAFIAMEELHGII